MVSKCPEGVGGGRNAGEGPQVLNPLRSSQQWPPHVTELQLQAGNTLGPCPPHPLPAGQGRLRLLPLPPPNPTTPQRPQLASSALPVT